jgi:hypothetical protein
VKYHVKYITSSIEAGFHTTRRLARPFLGWACISLEEGEMKKFVSLIPLLIFALLMVACGGGDKAISDGELHLTFDGESCIYEGPTLLKAGPVTLHFINESGVPAAVNLLKHEGDETIQDALEYIGEEPSWKVRPNWTIELGTWEPVEPGESLQWEGDLEPGIHHIVCNRTIPYRAWFGTGLTVEE